MTGFNPNTSPWFLCFYFAAAYREINGGEVGRQFCSPFSQLRRINHGEVRRGWRGWLHTEGETMTMEKLFYFCTPTKQRTGAIFHKSNLSGISYATT